MVGGHPDACALPELHLFRAETVGEWLAMAGNESFGMDHGLVRAVAQLWWGEQTAATVDEARGWLRRRAHLTTGRLFEEITELLAPRVAVEKSPSLAYGPAALRRTHEMFPLARYVHLVSHPRLYGATVMDALARERAASGRSFDPAHWLARLAAFPPPAAGAEPAADDLDPQRAWLALHGNIVEFLATVPAAQQTIVHGEDLVADDPAGLVAVAAWLGLRTDPVAVAAMRHPER